MYHRRIELSPGAFVSRQVHRQHDLRQRGNLWACDVGVDLRHRGRSSSQG